VTSSPRTDEIEHRPVTLHVGTDISSERGVDEHVLQRGRWGTDPS
jgi:hypothetical protein